MLPVTERQQKHCSHVLQTSSGGTGSGSIDPLIHLAGLARKALREMSFTKGEDVLTQGEQGAWRSMAQLCASDAICSRCGLAAGDDFYILIDGEAAGSNRVM